MCLSALMKRDKCVGSQHCLDCWQPGAKDSAAKLDPGLTHLQPLLASLFAARLAAPAAAADFQRLAVEAHRAFPLQRRATLVHNTANAYDRTQNDLQWYFVGMQASPFQLRSNVAEAASPKVFTSSNSPFKGSNRP